MGETILKTTDLEKVINGRTIVTGISIELYGGEIFGFLGPNGAGKSTTIKMIVGLSSISKGDVSICGYSVKNDFRKAMQQTGCIVENPELYKYMSGYDNLRMIAKMYKGIDDARIREVIKLVGLERAMNDKVKTYSLGMKQRLGIASALLNRPKLLILDEPTNGLDPAGIKQMRELLRMLASEKGMSVFVSSHILSEIEQMCDRVGIINKGKMITVKKVSELVEMAGNETNSNVVVKTSAAQKAADVLSAEGYACKLLPDGVHVETKNDMVPKIVEILAKAEVPVYGMENSDTQSLENIFMKLTGDGNDEK